MIKKVNFDKFNEVREMQKLSYQLDKSLDTPLYLQLYQQIRSLIHAQELKRGDRLPTG